MPIYLNFMGKLRESLAVLMAKRSFKYLVFYAELLVAPAALINHSVYHVAIPDRSKKGRSEDAFLHRCSATSSNDIPRGFSFKKYHLLLKMEEDS